MWLTTAFAVQTGIVVQFSANGLPVEDEVACLLAVDDTVTEVVLNDSGESPDVGPEDGRWSGALMGDGDAFEVTLVVDGEEHALGEAAFEADGSPRDLVLAWRDGAFSMEAGAAGAMSGPAGTPVEGGGAPVDPQVGGGGPESPEGRSPAVTLPGQPSAKQDDSMLLIGLGVGLLVLAGIVFAWIRGSGSPGYRIKTRARLHPEPALLGGPSLSEGIHTVASTDPKAAATELLVELSKHHRVLVAGLPEPPSVWGGPVYVAESEKAVHIGDAAEDLLGGPGMPLVVLVVGIEGIADQLPEGVGGLIVGATGDWTFSEGRLQKTAAPAAPAAPAPPSA